MNNAYIICLRWRLSGKIELFTTISKLYEKYDKILLNVSKHTLYRKDLKGDGYINSIIEVKKIKPNT